MNKEPYHYFQCIKNKQIFEKSSLFGGLFQYIIPQIPPFFQRRQKVSKMDLLVHSSRAIASFFLSSISFSPYFTFNKATILIIFKPNLYILDDCIEMAASQTQKMQENQGLMPCSFLLFQQQLQTLNKSSISNDSTTNSFANITFSPSFHLPPTHFSSHRLCIPPAFVSSLHFISSLFDGKKQYSQRSLRKKRIQTIIIVQRQSQSNQTDFVCDLSTAEPYPHLIQIQNRVDFT